MKAEKVKDFFHKKAVKMGSFALAAMLAAGGLWTAQQQGTTVPELVTFVDTEEQVIIEEDEVPLAATKVTKSTKTTKKTKKIKMKTASKKTYTKAGKTTKKTQTKKTSTQKSSTTTKTETQTKITNKYKKGSKINTQVTTVKTTVTKTVVAMQSASAAATTAAAVPTSGSVALKTAAPKLNSQVAAAFEKLHFTIEVNSSVAYSGKFSARSQNIILKKVNDTVYHELGHFAAFAAGNADLTAEWKNVYNSEKSLYTGSNKAYVLSTASEYFAESFKDYTLNPAALKTARPQTYAAIEAAVAKITDAQINAVWNTYQSIWK